MLKSINKYLIILIFIFHCFCPQSIARNINADDINKQDRLEYINMEWWEKFDDELLMKYIISGLNNNYNLKTLHLKINELYQNKNIEISKEFPSFSVGANYLGLKIPRTAIPYQGFRDNAFALPFIVHWEIDLFLKRKNKIDMAYEDFKGAIYEEKGAMIALVSEIAGLYFNIANLDEQINIQKKVIKNKEEKLSRIQKGFNSGVYSKERLNNANKEIEYENIILNDYKKQRLKFLDNLAYLIGETPQSAKDFKFSKITEIEFKDKIPNCVSSDVTIYRPDILKKEAMLKKAKIDVTLARKEFLPNINVFGVLMFSTLTPNFGWNGAVANLLAGATQNIFSGGRRIFNLKQKKYAFERVLNEYYDTDLAALKEINDALYYLKEDEKSYISNIKSLGFEEDNFIRVNNSFRAGTTGAVDVLERENNFLYEKSKVLNSKVQKFADLISLYKAVGGRL